jgi:hypothetical protein
MMKPGDFDEVSVGKMLHFVQDAELLNDLEDCTKDPITVKVHGSLRAHPSVFYWGC